MQKRTATLVHLPFVLLLYALMAPVILAGALWLIVKLSWSIGEDAGGRLVDLICGTSALRKK